MKPILCLLSLALLVLVEYGSCAALETAGDDEPVYLVGGQRERRGSENDLAYQGDEQRERRGAENDLAYQDDEQRERREAEAEYFQLEPEAERFRRAVMNSLENNLGEVNFGEPQSRERRWWSSLVHGAIHGVGAFAKHLFGKR